MSSHRNEGKRQGLGMWSTISHAVRSGWGETFRLALILLVLGFLMIAAKVAVEALLS